MRHRRRLPAHVYPLLCELDEGKVGHGREVLAEVGLHDGRIGRVELIVAGGVAAVAHRDVDAVARLAQPDAIHVLHARREDVHAVELHALGQVEVHGLEALKDVRDRALKVAVAGEQRRTHAGPHAVGAHQQVVGKVAVLAASRRPHVDAPTLGVDKVESGVVAHREPAARLERVKVACQGRRHMVAIDEVVFGVAASGARLG